MKIVRELFVSYLLILFPVFWYCLPKTLFQDPVSDILLAPDSTLLGARIAIDGQWRFPQIETLPPKIVHSLIVFEDKRFYKHPGVDPIALVRAVTLNLRQKRIVSGGSTLTMQVIRLSRKGKKRTIYEKMIELILSLRMELTYSKDEILKLYLSHAPFGGNIVGVEAASWRYFGRSASNLSWAESAMLAVLPNAPSIIHPGRNRNLLKTKRDNLLRKLMLKGVLDHESYSLAIDEPLPLTPQPLPNEAPHLLETSRKLGRSGRIYCAIHPQWQRQAKGILHRYSQQYMANHIYNAGLIVMDNQTNEPVVYVGNNSFENLSGQGCHVDMVTAERSTGSLLKPFLYAAMLDAGQILPETLIPDIPLYIDGFSPQNYNKDFHGAVHARTAISRSLNVPLVKMLQQYDYGRFHKKLRELGMTTLHRPAAHYGLSLILGGAEGSLWDMTHMYANQARYLASAEDYKSSISLSKASLWFMFEAMAEVNRPEEEADWQSFSGMKRIAWKTGTSYGARDAWAIGSTTRYTVGVWVGNASGEGRAGLTGVGYAAPILFDIFSFLPASEWFPKPFDEMQEMAICRLSGYRAGAYCAPCDTLLLPVSGRQTDLCPYHHPVMLDETGQFRVNSECYPPHKMVERNWFTLPPAQEWYYRSYNASYVPLPPIMDGCESSENRIDMIYPNHNMRIYLPVGFSGHKEKFVFKAAHTRPDAILFWHINQDYWGETHKIHEMAVALSPGNHTLTLLDETGYTRKINFTIVGNSANL